MGNPASTIEDLERTALRNELTLVEGMLWTCAPSQLTQSSTSFAVTATQATETGYVTDSEIGVVAGTIVKATGLRDPQTSETISPELYCVVDLQKVQRVEPHLPNCGVCLSPVTILTKVCSVQATRKGHWRGRGMERSLAQVLTKTSSLFAKFSRRSER